MACFHGSLFWLAAPAVLLILTCGERGVLGVAYNPYQGGYGLGFANLNAGMMGHGDDYDLRQTVTYLERKLDNVHKRLEDAEFYITHLAREECLTGIIAIRPDCSVFTDGAEDFTGFIIKYFLCLATIGPYDRTGTVRFPRSFKSKPVVAVSMTSLSVLLAKDCEVTVVDCDKDSFTINVKSDVVAPVNVDYTWYACPGRLFDDNTKLPKKSTYVAPKTYKKYGYPGAYGGYKGYDGGYGAFGGYGGYFGGYKKK